MSLEKIRKEIEEQTKLLPSNPVTLQRDVPESVVFYVRENQAKFQGVSVDRVYVRQYPQGTTAAHLLGYVKEVSAEQLEQPAYTDLEPGDEIGQDGVELSYDSVLRGVNGETRVPVDVDGIAHRPADERPRADAGERPRAFDRLGPPGGGRGRIRRARRRLRRARREHRRGARDGLLADLRPVGPGQARDLDRHVAAASSATRRTTRSTGAPAFNRAIAAGYPTGSTFKPVTALASARRRRAHAVGDHHRRRALQARATGFRNAGDAIYGPIAPARRAQGLLGRLLLHARRPAPGEHRRGRRRVHPGLGEVARASAT